MAVNIQLGFNSGSFLKTEVTKRCQQRAINAKFIYYHLRQLLDFNDYPQENEIL